MTTRLLMALLVASTVLGCGRVAESRLNPFNWFGRSQEAEPVATQAPTDGRLLVAQVITLRAEQVPGGAILRATGLPPRQGFYDGELAPVGDEVPVNGELVYEFRVASPYFETRVSTQQSREVIVGRFISNQNLEGARVIRVNGATNALVIRR